MDEISWFNDYSDMFSLEFDNLFNTIDFKSFESKENDSVTCAHRDKFVNKQPTSAGRVQVSSNL